MARKKPVVTAPSGRGRRKARPAATQNVDPPKVTTIVAIGASAGGLDPISRFFDAMPADSGLAFVVIQHLDPISKSLLPELLARHTTMTVRPARNGLQLRPNEVYIISPGVYLSISSGRLVVSRARSGSGMRMAIDTFCRSLAADRGKHGIGIIMSGTGTDGAEGLKALKEAGGLALVQDPSEAEHEGMPSYAVSVAMPDYVMPVKDMPAALLRYVAHNYVKARPVPLKAPPRVEAGLPQQLSAVVETLKSTTGQSFERYKPGTLQRRIERRMALHSIEDWAGYLAMLKQSPAEANALASDLLIHVTEFFRDPKAFAYLGERALPALLSRHPADQPLRVWVPGCSTGEEAYSIGMLLLEQIAASRRRLLVQIFATDIDEAALQVARTAIYPDTIQARIAPERLARFFVPLDGHFKIADALRQCVIFSRHDLLNDPPFSRLDLVSCRNVLIYLKPDAQHRIVSLFHFALREGGLLLLGKAESLGTANDLFEPLEREQRIYQRVGRMRLAGGVPSFAHAERRGEIARVAPSAPPPQSMAELVERTMIETYAPAAVVTNRLLGALYYFGPIDRYLQIAAGAPHQDLLSMAREGLRPRLRDAISRAFRSKRRVTVPGVRYKRNGRSGTVTIEAQHLGGEHEGLVLVTFLDELPQIGEAARRGRGDRAKTSALAQMQQELTDTRRELNRTIRELQRANEEMKATNEEAMSLNEEFLSSNEELETSKEELQSLNEELTTINAQLRQALEQQQQSSTDLSNLLNSSGVATIFLDVQLRIKIFNTQMKRLFALIDTDAGRPLADLLPKFADPQLQPDATAACASGTSIEREIHAESGAWYMRSVQPYRSEIGAIEGAVVTFTDVSPLKKAQLDAAASSAYAETIVDTVREPLVVLDPELKIVSANSAFAAAFGVAHDQIVGRAVNALKHPLFAQSSLIELLSRQAAQQSGGGVVLEVEAGNGALHLWQADVHSFHLPASGRAMILLALSDITDERRVVRRQLQLMIDALPGAFIAVDQQRRINFASKRVEALFGYRAEELVGRPIDVLIPAELRVKHAGLHAGFFANPITRPMGSGLDINGLTKDGKLIPLDVALSPMPTADGFLVLASIYDLRAQKQAELQLRDAKAEAERANLAKSRFLAAASHDLRQPLQTIGLLHGVLAKRITEPDARAVVGRLEDTVARMTEILDTLLDINQIESGAVRPRLADFSVAQILSRARDEFTPLAAAKGLELRVVRSSATVRSDARLLARMVANLLSNAVKYTDRGKILLGCRRRGGEMRIEVWDSGIGISQENIDAIFEEFYRVDAADSGRFGLGLGLYIVRRYAALLGHRVEVRSRPGKGTMFALSLTGFDSPRALAAPPSHGNDRKGTRPTILLIEDDPDQLDTMRVLLDLEGYDVAQARRADEALALLSKPANVYPALVLADYNLPGGTNGLEVVRRVRSTLGTAVPALIVSGDKSPAALEAIEASGYALITKPVKAGDLLAAARALIKAAWPDWQATASPAIAAPATSAATYVPDIAVIDDEADVRDAFRITLETQGHKVATYASAEAFLADPQRGRFRCLLVDMTLPGIDGLALQARLRSEQLGAPLIFVTGSADLPNAVKAMREGAADFLQKPVASELLMESVARALRPSDGAPEARDDHDGVAARLGTLTAREHEVMERMINGEATKNIAAGLGISERTAEHHRQSVMRKMGAKSLAMLVRMVILRGAGG